MNDSMFLIIIYQILNDNNFHYTISWSQDGEQILIFGLKYLQILVGNYDIINTFKNFNFEIYEDFWGVITLQHPNLKKNISIDNILDSFEKPKSLYGSGPMSPEITMEYIFNLIFKPEFNEDHMPHIFNIMSNNDININDLVEGDSLLQIATLLDLDFLVIELINNGVNLNYQNGYGSTALHMAIVNKNDNISELLINSDINMDLQDNIGNTALHHAVINNNTFLTRILVQKGANKHIINNDNKSPFGYITVEHAPELVNNLLQIQNHNA